MEIIDISMVINENTIVYPGNPKVKINQYASIPKNSINESSILMGCHTGTHVDAPFHIRKDGYKANKLSLKTFYGKCRVLDLTHIDLEIHKEDLERFNLHNEEILLLKTQNSSRGYEKFHQKYVHVKYDAAKYLIKQQIKTLGVDYLSVKKFGGDDDVHEILINNLTLFEGLILSKVSGGNYLFVGLPLRLECDGAPARAILIKK